MAEQARSAAAQQFAALSPEAQAAIREKQRKRKMQKQASKTSKQAAPTTAAAAPCSVVYSDRITSEAYFDACPGGRFRDPRLPPIEVRTIIARPLGSSQDAVKVCGPGDPPQRHSQRETGLNSLGMKNALREGWSGGLRAQPINCKA